MLIWIDVLLNTYVIHLMEGDDNENDYNHFKYYHFDIILIVH